MRFILAVFLAVGAVQGQVRFEDHFVDKTLRIDYFHVGNATDELVTLDRFYEQGTWGGTTKNLIDPFNLGRYAVKIYDVLSNRLIYSRGYDSYFGEYKTTKPAKDGTRRTFHETVLVPFPRNRVLVVFEMRDRQNIYRPMWTFEVDPLDYHLVREPAGKGFDIYEVLTSGSPHEKVDLVFVAEGYTLAEQEKFEKDLRRYTDYFFSLEPYGQFRRSFNISGVFVPSPESGVDEPRQGRYRSTALGATFNSLDSDRYLLTEDNKALRDAAGQVPYDLVVVLANIKRYGGGGIYNVMSLSTTDGTWPEYVFHHEFAHAFAGLGDEYYSSDVAYEEFHSSGIEPAEANLTALLDPENLKWKELVTPGLSIPTEWGRRTFDSLGAAQSGVGRARAEKLAALKREGASDAAVKAAGAPYDSTLKRLGDEILAFMEDHPLHGKIGAFEGGGYVARGIYRPTVNSLMHQFNNADRVFYAVNERAIERMIRWLCGEAI